MAQEVELKKDGLKKKGFVGFSWTTFFFNFFVPLFRKDWGSAGIMFGISFAITFLVNTIFTSMIFAIEDPEVLLALLGISALMPAIIGIIVNIFFASRYNKKYTKKLLDNGWEPAGDSERAILKAEGLISA